MSTSLQRTYRNLRIGIAATVVLIVVAVAVAAAGVGLLPSISAYYYTPARNVFVGALIAAAIAIIALSGRGLQRTVLDAAGLFAPLVALVPTPVRPGSIPGFADGCAAGATCLPAAAVADVEVGVATYLVVGFATVAIAAVVAAASRGRSLAADLPRLALACAVLVAVALAWLFARDAFLAGAHLAAAVAFFGLIAVAAVANAFGTPDTEPPPTWRAALYGVIAVAMAVDLAVIVGVVLAGETVGGALPPVLVGETVALLLFLAFWVLQSLEKWSDDDPSVAAAAPGPATSSGSRAEPR